MSKINAIVLVASLWASEGSATPVIQEVFYDALGPDTSSVFTELYGCPGIALNSWSLVGVNGANGRAYRTLELTGAVIPADGLLVLATASAAGTLLAVRDFVANVDWQNGPDSVLLYDAFGGLADALQYGNAGTHNNREAGTPASDPGAGLRAERLRAHPRGRVGHAAAPSREGRLSGPTSSFRLAGFGRLERRVSSHCLTTQWPSQRTTAFQHREGRSRPRWQTGQSCGGSRCR